ncbi:MAG: DUF4129 domain-containing protein [Caldilinea sp.]|nr:DUF4129 domain-containing protein [Caldilinea sp.]MDW8440572.1 DUF4129 domain-containing protein [Caldilineaceae bacterium]
MNDQPKPASRILPVVIEAAGMETPPQPAAEQYDRDWLGALFRPALVIIMVSSMNVAILAFLRQYAPEMAPSVRWTIVGMGVLAAIIGSTTTTWLALPAQRLLRSSAYRAAEIFLLVALARFALWLAAGTLPGPLVLLNDPSAALLDGVFLFALVTILVTWYAAIDFTDDLTRMALQPDELWLNQRTNIRFADSARPAPTGRAAILRGFVARWVAWGIGLILLVSTLRLGVTRPGFWSLTRLDIDPLAIGAILIYFLSGLLLISQGQLAVLRAHWTIDRIPAMAAIVRNWPIYTVLVIAFFAVAAAFLPLGDTYLLSIVLATILNVLFALAYLLYRLLMAAIFLLLSLLPFAAQRPEEATSPPPAETILREPPEMLVIPPWMGGAFFWLSALLLLSYAARIYFSDKQMSLAWLRRFWMRLLDRWPALFNAATRWRSQNFVPDMDGKRTTGHRSTILRRLTLWRLLTPEQRVRFLYFRLLEQGAAQGVARRAAETPIHYAVRLENALDASAETRAAIDALTDAFIQIRYAGETVKSDDVDALRQTWERLRKTLSAKAVK